MMKKYKSIVEIKQNKGITLIALIITIIVLLILAGITLAMVVGDNGIIKKAQTAKDKTNESQSAEENQLRDYENKIDSNIFNSRNLVSKTVLFSGEEKGVKTRQTATASLSEEFTNYDFLIFTLRWDSPNNNAGFSQYSIDTDTLKDIVLTPNSSNHLLMCPYSNAYIMVNFDTDFKKFWINEGVFTNSGGAPQSITKVIGIKCN